MPIVTLHPNRGVGYGSNVSGIYEAGCYLFPSIFEYNIPDNILQYDIISVAVSFRMKGYMQTTLGQEYFIKRLELRPAFIRSFAGQDMFTNIDYNNVQAIVQFGTGTAEELTIIFDHNQAWTTFNRDITGFFKENVKNGKFYLDIREDMYHCCNYWIDSDVTMTIEYGTPQSSIPAIISPNEQYFMANNPIPFQWVYMSNYGFEQIGINVHWHTAEEPDNYELHYFWVSTPNREQTYTADVGTFPVGTIYYRLQTVDTDGNYSDWAYGKFVVRERVTPPSYIEVENKALTKITWNSSLQTAYELELYKGEELIGEEKYSALTKEYKPNMFLEDGEYSFRIRIKDSYNTWSDWIEKMFTISTTKPNKPTIRVYCNGTVATIDVQSTIDSIFIYRVENGIETCIAKNTKHYEDKEMITNTSCQYYARAFENGFSDSERVNVKVNTKGFILSNSKNVMDIHKSIEKLMPLSESIGIDRRYNNYLGRELPVFEQSRFKSRTVTRKAFVKEQQLNILYEIANGSEIVLYRDSKSRKFYGTVTINSANLDFLGTGYSVEITIRETDNNKGVILNE